jgi:hypothetical protein
MNQGDLSPHIGTLRFALKDLMARWEETKEVWNDGVSQRFAERNIEPLEPTVTSAVKSIERLGQLMMQAALACSPDRE